MKSALTMLVIFGFISIAVFGFLGMSHESGHGHGGCIAATSNGALCPGQNRFDFASFHINSFKNFSTAVLGNSAYLLFFVFLFFLSGIFSGFWAAPQANLVLKQARLSGQHASSHGAEILRWLSLHEASPHSF